ncbi:unnamed protein product [Didymodactylos carnosus]|uniref:Uncharacterized protein n=1 Tax=Didymodactylos carnosus TaxID=1234261 RepID=A0A8S2U6J9_9BILA|nr:unnamed protein product [Didymodactylos carnosus]CAF4326907.1 unnamed protein product [Didymodactylos carnosus]
MEGTVLHCCIAVIQSSSRWLSSPMPDTIIPYPFTLYPSPFPYHEYENACRMQYGINKLIYRLASNIDLLDSVLLGLVDCDDFVRKLQDISQQIQNLPYKSVAEGCIIRTDYMLQTNVNEEHFHKTRLRLIEINTIAVGLGGAAKLMSQWHKYERVIQEKIIVFYPFLKALN